jgi:hypothetical protein
MKTMNDLAIQAVHDALSLRCLADGTGFIRTADPRAYMDADRLRLAEEVAKQLPADATQANASAIAIKMEPVIRALVGK